MTFVVGVGVVVSLFKCKYTLEFFFLVDKIEICTYNTYLFFVAVEEPSLLFGDKVHCCIVVI